MQGCTERVRDLSLAGGEQRLLYVQARSILVGVKGGVTMVEELICLGDASFKIRAPVRQGESRVLSYGGHVVLHAGQPSCVRLVSPPSLVSACTHRLAEAGVTVLRLFNACCRRLRRRATA
jgi:hypothetical protein